MIWIARSKLVRERNKPAIVVQCGKYYEKGRHRKLGKPESRRKMAVD